HTKSGIFTNKAYNDLNDEALYSTILSRDNVKYVSDMAENKQGSDKEKDDVDDGKSDGVSPDTSKGGPKTPDVPSFKV
ncbi:MAG: hypothetical protein KAJ56_04490, partial [Candidatus Aenigmarchaeota archaeon]|nr:hypothetical protein [Candidatus Aenigmarchaeota archaeon]